MASIHTASGQIDILRRSRWRPKLRAGRLWIRDRAYHLYAKKRTIIIRDTLELRHTLSGLPVAGTMAVFVEGVRWDKWRIEGRDIIVSLEGIEGNAAYWAMIDFAYAPWDFFKTSVEALPDNEIRLEYDFYQWNSAPYPTGQKFDVSSMNETFRIADADVVNRMPADYQPGHPIVITDDTKLLTDARDYQLQFRATMPSRNIEFNGEPNLLQNPHFATAPTGDPSGAARWYETDPTGAHRQPGTGYVGGYVYVVYPTGRVVQEVDVEGGQPLVAEAWVRGTGSAILELAYRTPGTGRPIVDPSGNVIGYGPDFGVFSVRGTGMLTSEWARIAVVLGEGTGFDPADALFPDICDRIELRLGALNGCAEFGAVQLRSGVRAGQYIYVDSNATVEYETDQSGFYQHRPTGAFPYEDTWDADMNSINDEAHLGFLMIEEGGEPNDEGLGIGELTWDDPAAYGTGYQQGVVPWPFGVRHEFGRRHLPYAKLKGHQKLRETQVFDLENQPPSRYEATIPSVPREPRRISIMSPGNMYRDSNGVVHLILNVDRQEIIVAIVTDMFGNPIIGDWMQVLPSGLVDAVPSGAYTNHGGRIMTRAMPGSGAGPATGLAALQFRHYKSGRQDSILIDIV